MNTTMTDPAPDTVRRLTTRQLGAVEAKRMLLHVSYLVCIAVTVLSVATLFTSAPAGGFRPMSLAYAALLLLGAMFYPLTTVVAANRVGSSTFRRASQETLGVTPMAERQRTVAACLGVVRGPVVVGGAIMVLADLVAPLVDDTGGLAARNILENLQIPVTVLGGGLLGIALARWVRVPGVLALVVLALWFGHFTVSASLSAAGDAVHGAASLGLMPTWVFSDASMAGQSSLAQEMWHLMYLLGLGLLAGVAALLHAPENRRRLVLVGAGLIVLTGVAGVLQMG